MCTERILTRCVLGISLTGLLLGSTAIAQYPVGQYPEFETQEKAEMTQEKAQAESGLPLRRTSKLIGRAVHDPEGERLGTIHDLVLTPDYERVSYVALSFGGVLGIGDKLCAIPFSAIRPGPGDTCVLSITKEQLENAEGFGQDGWPSEPDPRWSAPGTERPMASEQEHTPALRPQPQAEHPGEHPAAATEGRDVQRRRVTRLTGLSVKNAAAQDIGKVEEFVVALARTSRPMHSGEPARHSEATPPAERPEQGHPHHRAAEGKGAGYLAYTVISLGGFLGFGEEYALVPAGAVKFQPRVPYARLDADKETLEAIAFRSRQWPDLSSRDYAQEIHDRFNQQPYWVVLGYVAPGAERTAASRQAWAPDSPYNRKFDAASIKTLEGTVESVGAFEPAAGVREGLSLRIKTEDGQTYTIHAGPRWYVQEQDFAVKAGDKVKVAGSQVRIGEQSVIMGVELESGGKTLKLRSDKGEPKWQMPQSQREPTSGRSDDGQKRMNR